MRSFRKLKGLRRWGILLLLLPIVWMVFPSSDYYALTVAAGDIGVSLGSPLPTLHSPSHSQAVSRVQHRRLMRDVVGGVLFCAPSTLCGSLIFAQGKFRLTCAPKVSFVRPE